MNLFVSKREPFIELALNTIVQQGKRFFQHLSSITNSSATREVKTTPEPNYYYYNTPQSGFFPAGVPDISYMGSLFICLYVISQLYDYFSSGTMQPKKKCHAPSVGIDWLTNMPEDIQQRMYQLKELSALNTQLSIHHVFAGLNPDTDPQGVARQLDDIACRVNDELIVFFDSHPMAYNALFYENAMQIFEQDPERMISGNGTFIQLIALANKSEDKAMRSRAQRLYDTYLCHRDIARYTQVPRFGHSETRAVDWGDKDALNYILLPASHLKIAMLVSLDTLEKMLDTESVKPEQDSFQLYNSSGVPLVFDDYPLEAFFETHYPLFIECIDHSVREKEFSGLLEIIIPNDEIIRQLFFSSRSQSHSDTKLTGAENFSKLMQIFGPWLRFSFSSDSFSLDEKHCQNILAHSGMRDGSPTEQAKMLLSLAVVFIKCAGGKIFGTEDESPQLIREYAQALMNKAYTLDSSVFKSGIAHWNEALLAARYRPANCEIVARLMIEHNKITCPEVLAEVLPPAWY